jgi:hypothetical protein
LVVCAAAPIAYVHTLAIRADGAGADDGGIFRIAPPGGALERVNVTWSEPGGWVSQLLGASADGSTLHVVVSQLEASDEMSCRFGYHLASLDASTGKLILVAALLSAFA